MTTEGLTLLIFSMTLFALLYGNRYLSNKERMFMIEKGIYQQPAKKEQFLTTLKIALLLIGTGLGFFSGFLLSTFVFKDLEHPEVIYFSMIGLLAGIGLLFAFFFEKNYKRNQ